MKQIQTPFTYFTDARGDSLDAGKIYIGTVGANAETSPIAVYWDEAGTQPAAQPLRTSQGYIVNGVTKARAYISADDYSMIVKDHSGLVIASTPSVESNETLRDDLASSATGKGSRLVAFIQRISGAVSRWVEDKLAESISDADFMTAAQIADVQSGALTLDVTAAMQAALNAAEGRKLKLIKGNRLITAKLSAPQAIHICGQGRDSSLFTYKGATTLAGGIIEFDGRTAFSVRDLGFRCTSAVVVNNTIQLHIKNPVYFEVSGITFGASGSASGANNIIGCLVEQTSSGFVPPRGNGVFRDILYVVEPTDSGGSLSRGIHIKGHASQRIEHISFEGEGNIEHAYYGIHVEHANHVEIGKWQMRGSTNTEIRLDSADSCVINAPQIIPPTGGTGIYIASTCVDNVVIAPGWNFSSGAPSSALTDLGARTTVIHPGAPGAITIQGKLNGSYLFSKQDGVGDNIKVVRSTTDTDSALVLQSDVAVSADAWIGVNRGSGPAGQDIVRIEGGGDLFERVASDGQRYLRGSNSAPSDASLANSQVAFYLDESGSNLKVKVKYAGGTVKTGSVPLT
jgi:hypothetical protein